MNKRILKLLFALTACAATLLICTVHSSAALAGDIADGDNLVTSNDARAILRAAVGLDSLTEEQKDIADIDGDGQITAADARSALRIGVALDPAIHYYQKEIVTPATCTEKGLMKLTCTECEDVKEQEIEALGHDKEGSEWTVITPADCTTAGLREAACSRCAEKLSEEIEALGHDFPAPEVLIEATCEEDGLEKYTCQREGCEHSEEKAVPALTHAPSIPAATCTEDQICTRCSLLMAEKLGHTTDWGVCGNCKLFNTEKYKTEAEIIKTKFNEAKTAFDAAYALNGYNAMIDGVSYKVLSQTKAAKPYYQTAQAAYEAAYAACGDIPEFAAIKELLAKNISNIKGSLTEVDKIIKFCNGNSGAIDARNYDKMVSKLENYNAGWWESDYKDHTTAVNKKLVKAIAW